MIYKTALSVANAIYDAYKGTKTVYFTKVRHGLEKPCFFVRVISTSYKRQIAGFFLISQRVQIRYIPKKEDYSNEECMEVEYDLMQLLEQIPFADEVSDKGVVTRFNGEIRGINLNSLDIDGELIFNVEYVFRVYSKSEKYLMQTLATNAKPKLLGG